MTEEQTLDSVENVQPAKRPVFITVLAVLTFVGSGLTILSALFSLLQSQKSEYDQLLSNPAANDLLAGMPSYEDFIMWSNISNFSNLFSSLICIVGAILMLKLKKVGFYAYLLGSIIFVSIIALATSAMLPDSLKWVAIISTVVYGLFSAAFIIMYAVNLKHMK